MRRRPRPPDACDSRSGRPSVRARPVWSGLLKIQVARRRPRIARGVQPLVLNQTTPPVPLFCFCSREHRVLPFLAHRSTDGCGVDRPMWSSKIPTPPPRFSQLGAEPVQLRRNTDSARPASERCRSVFRIWARAGRRAQDRLGDPIVSALAERARPTHATRARIDRRSRRARGSICIPLGGWRSNTLPGTSLALRASGSEGARGVRRSKERCGTRDASS